MASSRLLFIFPEPKPIEMPVYLYIEQNGQKVEPSRDYGEVDMMVKKNNKTKKQRQQLTIKLRRRLETHLRN